MTKEISKINDYDVNLTLLIQQYKDKPKFKGILEAISDQADDLETAIFEIRDQYYIDTAEGVQLDVLGEIQDIAREGRTDTDYRTVIRAKIIVNNGSGEFETVITLLTEVFGASFARLQNMGNANLLIWTDLVITVEQFETLLNTIAAGVGLYVSFGSSNPFVFFDDPDGAGFGGYISDTLAIDDGTGLTTLAIDDGTGLTERFIYDATNGVGSLQAGGGELQGKRGV